MNELLRLEGVTKRFPITGGIFNRTQAFVHAVEDVSFSIREGQTLGLVGESGCGKSTIAKLILKLIEPTEGKILFDQEDIFTFNHQATKLMRREIQLIFQNPYASLNPRKKIRSLLSEPLKIHRICESDSAIDQRLGELLDYVQIPNNALKKYPHEFSGGQRQRISIARALAVDPKLIVFDEPVSALDVSVRAQILNLLKMLQKELNLTYLFISHDLKVVEFMAHEIAVMYLGKIVELGQSRVFFEKPRHPYTKALISAIPRLHPGEKNHRIILQGDVPNPIQPPKGCHFHPRCWRATKECEGAYPPLTSQKDETDFRCYHPL